MATLERPARPQPAPSTSERTLLSSQAPSAFDLSAFRDPAERTAQTEDDLIDLGQERLFSGTRTAARRVGKESEEVGRSEETHEGEGQRDQQGSQELLGSLGAARQAFLFALSSLIQEYLPALRTDSPPTANSSNPFADTASSLASARHPSLSALASPSQAPDAVLTSLLDTLCQSDRTQPRQSSTSTLGASPVMRSIERTSPLLGSPHSASSAPASETQAQVEELQARVEAVAADLPPTEAELARSLASLLTCIERLSSISRLEGALDAPAQPQTASSFSATAPAESSSANVYETLEREASALQSRRDLRASEAERFVGAARAVERAERELLWGRVGDLSERVRLLSRQRAELVGQEQGAPEEETRGEPGQKAEREGSVRSRSSSLYEPSLSDLPRYSHDHDPAQHNGHLPPAYYTDYAPDAKEELGWDVKPPQTPSVQSPGSTDSHAFPSTASRATGLIVPAPAGVRTRKISSAHSEKMQRDLDSVTEAIERLYVVSPQLANQRVEPDRRMQRERQLARLGNAIERLSQGRLEDQRAVPSPIVGEEEPESAAQRRKRESAALDRLLDQIDKAASRTLADQRVELNGKRKEVLNADTANPDFEPLSDKYEARRREYILSHTGKGRLAGQDATLHSSGFAEAFPRPRPELNEPVTITEFFADTDGAARPQDLSAQSTPSSSSAVKKKFSSKSLFQPKLGEDDAPAGKKGTLRIGVFKRNGSGVRRGSYDASGMTGLGVFGTGMSRSTSTSGLEVLAVSQFDWITEESRNLGTLVVTFWPRASTSNKDEEFEVVSIDGDSILVAPSRGGPASRLSLPCRVIPQQATVNSLSGVHEVKLITIDPSPTKSRADLEVHTPLSTDELRRSMPTSFACSTCNAQLADTSAITRYNALPSEHWAELLDAWMCHQDQELSADLIAKGKGIKPRPDEGLVGTSYILLPQETTMGWTNPAGSEPTRSPSDDLLYPAHCSSCNSLIGSHVKPLDPTSTVSTSVRLLKYATYPSRQVSNADLDAGRVPPPRYSLASFLTAEMLETGQAHACHRFVLDDAETEQAKLLLWFFNPAVRLSFSSSAATASILDLAASSSLTGTPSSVSTGSPSTSSTSSVKLTSRSMNAVKVFYAAVSSDADPRCADFLDGDTHTAERIAYPAPVLARVKDLLQASTAVYPLAKRKWIQGNLDVGFLERI
ncbi:hypothetical protein JCM10207_001079 [Rhodosporidiobolus poonsookiae]